MPDSVAEMVQREKVRQMVAAEKARTAAPAPTVKPKPRVGFYPATPEETAKATAFLDKPPVPGMTVGSRMGQELDAYNREVGGAAQSADEAAHNLSGGEILHDPVGAVRDVGRVAGAVIAPVTALADRVLQPGGSETERKIMWGLRTPLDAPGAATHDLTPYLGEKGAEALVSGAMLAAPFARGAVRGGLGALEGMRRPGLEVPPLPDVPTGRGPVDPMAAVRTPAPSPATAFSAPESYRGPAPAPPPAPTLGTAPRGATLGAVETLTDGATNRAPWIGLDERLARRGMTIHDALDAALREDRGALARLPDRDANYVRGLANEYLGARRQGKAALDQFFQKVTARSGSESAPSPGVLGDVNAPQNLAPPREALIGLGRETLPLPKATLEDPTPGTWQPTRTRPEGQPRTPINREPPAPSPNPDEFIRDEPIPADELNAKAWEGAVPEVRASLRARPMPGDLSARIKPFSRVKEPLPMTAQGGGVPREVVEIGPEAPPPEPPPPSGATLGAKPPKRPLTPGDERGAIRTQLSEKIDNLKGFSPDLFYKVKEALSLKSARTAKPVRDLQQALKNISPEEAQGLTPAIMERRAKGTPAQNAFVEWWHRTHPNLREHLKQVGSRVVETRDLADLPETIPPDWNLKEIGPGKYLVTRPINAVPDFFPMRMSEAAREALKAGDPVVTEAIYGEGVKQGAWKDKAGFDQYLETYEAPNLKSTAAGLERPRKFRVPDEYREPDVVKTLNRYMQDVGKTSSEQSVFHYFDEKTGEPRALNHEWAPQGDLGDIIKKLGSQGPAAEEMALDILGRDPRSWSDMNRKSIEFSNKVGAVNALRLYGLRPTTALVQLTQSAMTNSFVGTVATAKAVARFIKNPRAVYEQAVRSGAVKPHSQYADTIGVREQGAKGGGVLNAVSDAAMKPMAMTDLAGRLIASATAEDFAAQTAKQLQGNAWSKRIAMKKLEALDYAPGDEAQFVKGLTPEQMDVLRQRIVERTQGEVTNASRIPAATTPVGRVLMQGKNFGIAQARNTWRVAGKQLFQAGNPIPAAKLVVGAYLAGKGIAAAKDALVGPSEKSRPDDALTALHEGSLGGYVGDVVYSGVRGKMQLDETLNRISDSQFAGLLATIAKAGYDINDPPTARKIATGQGPPIDIKKSRADVLIAALQNAAPTGKEWVRIYDHFIGDDTIRRHEANAKVLRELRKAQQGATLGAGAR